MPQYHDFLSGAVLTAAQMNTYLMNQSVIVCNNSGDYPSSPVEGMVVFDKAINRGLVYSGSGWVPAFGSMPSVSVYGPNASIDNGEHEPLVFATELWDSDSFWGSGSQITVPSGLGGIYSVTGVVTFGADGNGDRIARIYKNGAWTSGLPYASAFDPSPTLALRLNVAGVIELAAGDTVELACYQTTTHSLTGAGALQLTWMGS